jgi:hypothetical protein
MPTISKEFSEIYGSNGPLNYRKNTSINNLARNIVPNQEFNNNVSKNVGKNVATNVATNVAKIDMPSSANYTESSIPWGIIIFIAVILIIIGIIYYNKDRIFALFDKINKIDDVTKKTDDIIKKYEDEKIEKEQEHENSIQEKEREETIKKEKEQKGGMHELDAKINSVTSYKDNQKVKENGFCYIGYDNGQRECTNVFDGDICMSGELFPTMDICINPHLRK